MRNLPGIARIDHWLVDALLPGPADATWDGPGPAPEGLTEAAVVHGIEGWALRRARDADRDVPGLDTAVQTATARYQRALADLRTVSVALAAADVPFLVVKGPALVHQYYDSIGLRSFVDLDVVVRPADLTVALTALEGAGCLLLDANWPLLTRLDVHELRVLGPTGGPIDLHWSLGYGPGSAARVPPVDVLLERSQRLDLAGVETRVLDWADTVVHLALHAASSGGNRLVWCADLRAALGAAPPDADRLLVERALAWGAAPPLHLMLWRTHHAARMPVSPDLLRALAPSTAWSLVVRLVERVTPVARSGDGPSVARMLARSAGTDARSSWKALWGKGVQAVRGRGATIPAQALRNAADPRSGLFPVGGEAGRAAFLARVTGAPTPSD